MRYDYRELLKAKEEVDDGIERLKNNIKDKEEQEYCQLCKKVLQSGIIEEYLDLIELVDKPKFYYSSYNQKYPNFYREGITWCIDSTWLKSKYYIGCVDSSGSCGAHYDTLFLDMRDKPLSWKWCNGAGKKVQITSSPKYRSEKAARTMQVQILNSLLDDFDEFREEILDCFNDEMAEKSKQINDLAKEMGDM